MNEQFARANESFLALVTFVRFVFRVRSLVNFERAAPGELLRTLGADERPFTRVSAQVRFQRSALVERRTAFLANERPLAGVVARVRP